MKKLLTPLFLSLFLVACGGDDGGSISPTASSLNGVWEINKGGATIILSIDKSLNMTAYPYFEEKNCYLAVGSGQLKDKGNNVFITIYPDGSQRKENTITMNQNSFTVTRVEDGETLKRTADKSEKTVSDLKPLCKES